MCHCQMPVFCELTTLGSSSRTSMTYVHEICKHCYELPVIFLILLMLRSSKATRSNVRFWSLGVIMHVNRSVFRLEHEK